MEHVGGTSSWDCLGDQTLRKSWIAWVLLFVWWNLRIQDSLAFTYRYPTDNQEMPNRYESWEIPDPFLPCPRFLLWWFGIIFIDPSEDLRDRIQKLQESSFGMVSDEWFWLGLARLGHCLTRVFHNSTTGVFILKSAYWCHVIDGYTFGLFWEKNSGKLKFFLKRK